MDLPHLLTLVAAAGALLAATACSFDETPTAAALPTAAGELSTGHELHRMFHREKVDAAESLLPAQF